MSGLVESRNGSAEFDIRKHLLDGYDKVVLPSEPDRLALNFSLKFVQIMDVKDKEQLVSVECWYSMNWINSFLKWDKKKYQNESRVFFDPSEIWVPDIALYNNGDDKVQTSGGRTKFLTNIVVEDTGKCVWSGPVTFTFTCSMALSRWPFDDQNCTMKFGSLSYGKNNFIISKVKVSKSDDFIENSNWELKNITVALQETDHGDCCLFGFSQVTYTLNMARKFKYHMFYLVAPCLLMVILSLFSFWIPSESGERIGFVTTLLLAMMVFLLVVPDLIPESSTSIPILGVFLMATLVMVSLILMITIFVLVIHHKEGVPPTWIQKLFCGKPKPVNRVEVQSRDEDPFEPAMRAHQPNYGDVKPPNTPGPTKVFMREKKFTENNPMTYKEISEKLDVIFFWVFVLVSCVLYSAILTQKDMK
ncbi:predicted protein [Nematostella vectensis]|uniref:Uncharacterized protein n=1 Tax=Nematostella vectensis TaxID=45351 RepID=A7RLP3_NEMVE|nr:predicted protein [Nematostella vectensis]|eukprot:XP_001639702.1 predicted protein [Nematostella vectensis]